MRSPSPGVSMSHTWRSTPRARRPSAMRATVTALPRGESSGTGERIATRRAAMGLSGYPARPPRANSRDSEVAALHEIFRHQHGPAGRPHLGVVGDQDVLHPVGQRVVGPHAPHAGEHALLTVAIETRLGAE